MRKFFTTLKSVVATAIVASMTLAASCSYDDGAINERVDKVEGDLAALTERVDALEKKLNDEVAALKAVLDGNAVVTEVTTDEDGNTTIKLSDGKTITVLAGLQYRVVDGVLELSADGENWVAVSVAPECVVAEVVVNDDNTVTIKLANGEVFTVVKAELIEFGTTRSSLYVLPDQTKEITVTINDAVADINVMNQPLGWTAEIALKPAVEEPEEGAGDNETEEPGMPVTLAAGGTEYVLSITGPAKEFVDAGFADKEGYITVHFNTKSGACKVGKVLVSLAEITLSVSADGMIHIENSVVEEVQQGGPRSSDSDVVYDFADFFIGVIPAEVYAEDGDKSFTDNFDDLNYEYFVNVAATKRTTGFMNVVDELKQYEEGVTEKEVYDLSVETLAGAFLPVYEFEYGKEYIIFVSLEGEMVNYYEHPVLKGAVMDTYKKVLVEAKYVPDSATWNDASYTVSLAGFTCYAIGWFSEAEINQYLEQGIADSVEELIPMLLQPTPMYNPLMGTAIVADTFLNETVTLSSLAASSLTGWAPSIDPDTKYYLFVYPFNLNAINETELYTHEFVAENVHLFGTFETDALTKREFDPGITYEDVDMAAHALKAKVYFGTDVVAYYYKLYPTAAEVPSDRALEIMENEYIKDFSEYNYCKINDYVDTYPVYLCIVAINADGEYVYVEEKFEPVPLPEVAVKSWEYLGRYDEIADDNPDTNGGEFVYSVKCDDGKEYTLNLYYAYGNEDGSIKEGTYEYCGKTANTMYSSYAGFVIVSETEYNGSKLVVAADKITLTVAGVADYVYVPSSEPEQPEEPGEPEVTYDYDLAFTSATYSDGTLELKGADANDFLKLIVNPGLETLVAGDYVGNGNQDYSAGYPYPVLWTSADAKELDLNNSNYNMSANPAPYGQYYFSSDLKMSVALDGDVYSIVVTAISYIDGNKNVRFTYNGTIAAEAAGPDLTGYEEGTGANVDFNSGSGTVRFKLTYLDEEVVLQIYPFIGNESEVHFTVGQVEKLTLANFPAQSGTVDLYQQADGSYLVMVDATFQQVGAHKFYFYVTL